MPHRDTSFLPRITDTLRRQAKLDDTRWVIAASGVTLALAAALCAALNVPALGTTLASRFEIGNALATVPAAVLSLILGLSLQYDARVQGALWAHSNRNTPRRAGGLLLTATLLAVAVNLGDNAFPVYLRAAIIQSALLALLWAGTYAAALSLRPPERGPAMMNQRKIRQTKRSTRIQPR